ncbi:MAG TPA: lipid II flippase MurJ, partial [Terriglobales bacterium]|nr:lipid II flippase MurJ [Terriglobales bacterium]
NEKRLQEFRETVNNSVYRITAVSFLSTAWMMAAALPLIDLVYRRGRFYFSDSHETALFFFWFAISLAFWSAQALYARAFYAAGDTLTPMIASTIITLASLPMYGTLFRTFGVVGLTIASDLGIFANTAALALLLHRRKLVMTSALPWRELGKAGFTSLFALVLSYGVARSVPLSGSRGADFLSLFLVSITWAAAVAMGLWATRSELPGALKRRGQRTTYPHVAEKHAEEMSAGIEP